MTPSLRYFFGLEFGGGDWEEAVKNCERSFVRSRSQLALVRPGSAPSGHRLTAWEVWNAYGPAVIDDVIENGGAVLMDGGESPESVLISHFDGLGISWPSSLVSGGVSGSDVALGDVESLKMPVKDLGGLAFSFGLDERFVSTGADVVDAQLLRSSIESLKGSLAALSYMEFEPVVSALAEGVSVIRTQTRLTNWLGEFSERANFEVSPDYGNGPFAARQVGYSLGEATRTLLDLGFYPVDSVRDLAQDRLGIPVVSAELPEDLGAVVVGGGDDGAGAGFRGVVVNSFGENEDPWVQRVNVARGLGHALFDPVEEAVGFRVVPKLGDGSVDSVGDDLANHRAYAFALSLLAPEDRVRAFAPLPVSSYRVGRVMEHFRMCEGAARRRIESCYSGEAGEIPAARYVKLPGEEELDKEKLAWWSVVPGADSEVRSGKFSEVVARCVGKNLISSDTGALYLGCTSEELEESLDLGK